MFAITNVRTFSLVYFSNGSVMPPQMIVVKMQTIRHSVSTSVHAMLYPAHIVPESVVVTYKSWFGPGIFLQAGKLISTLDIVNQRGGTAVILRTVTRQRQSPHAARQTITPLASSRGFL
jgi:hypothetical protein